MLTPSLGLSSASCDTLTLRVRSTIQQSPCKGVIDTASEGPTSGHNSMVLCTRASQRKGNAKRLMFLELTASRVSTLRLSLHCRISSQPRKEVRAVESIIYLFRFVATKPARQSASPPIRTEPPLFLFPVYLVWQRWE